MVNEVFSEETPLGEEWVEGNVMGILDTGCTRTVCGEKWLARIVMCLTEGERDRMNVSQKKVERTYQFGASKYEAVKSVEVPCVIAGTRVFLVTEVVRGNIPWLIGCETLIRLGASIDLAGGFIRFGALGNRIMEYTRGLGGFRKHICLELIKEIPEEMIWFVGMKKIG
jgi:hypothetical protein